jgi:23S rRNA pseudoU1915 N3-methylase RlmH
MVKCCKENVPSAQLYHYTMSHDIVQMPLREQIARALQVKEKY